MTRYSRDTSDIDAAPVLLIDVIDHARRLVQLATELQEMRSRQATMQKRAREQMSELSQMAPPSSDQEFAKLRESHFVRGLSAHARRLSESHRKVSARVYNSNCAKYRRGATRPCLAKQTSGFHHFASCCCKRVDRTAETQGSEQIKCADMIHRRPGGRCKGEGYRGRRSPPPAQCH